MPSVIRRPNSDYSCDYWSNIGESDHYACVDEVTPDGWTSYVYSGFGVPYGSYELFGFPALSIPPGSKIFCVKLVIYDQPTFAFQTEYGIRVNGVNYHGYYTERTPDDGGPGWDKYEAFLLDNPDTGGPWTVDEVNNDIEALGMFTGWNGSGSVTAAYIEVVYDEFGPFIGKIDLTGEAQGMAQFEDTFGGVAYLSGEADVLASVALEIDDIEVAIEAESPDLAIQLSIQDMQVATETESPLLVLNLEVQDMEVDIESGRVHIRSVIPQPTAPKLSGLSPAPKQTGVTRNQPVCFVLYGLNNDGVDIDSIVVRINSTEYRNGDPEFLFTGDQYEYHVSVDHPVWSYEQAVAVEIMAQSKLGMPIEQRDLS